MGNSDYTRAFGATQCSGLPLTTVGLSATLSNGTRVRGLAVYGGVERGGAAVGPRWAPCALARAVRRTCVRLVGCFQKLCVGGTQHGRSVRCADGLGRHARGGPGGGCARRPQSPPSSAPTFPLCPVHLPTKLGPVANLPCMQTSDVGNIQAFEDTAGYMVVTVRLDCPWMMLISAGTPGASVVITITDLDSGGAVRGTWSNSTTVTPSGSPYRTCSFWRFPIRGTGPGQVDGAACSLYIRRITVQVRCGDCGSAVCWARCRLHQPPWFPHGHALPQAITAGEISPASQRHSTCAPKCCTLGQLPVPHWCVWC